MTGYTRRWDCRICKAPQETVDMPKPCVCSDCIERVAIRLCRDSLNVDYFVAGVDREHWRSRARDLIEPMLRRWKEPEPFEARAANLLRSVAGRDGAHGFIPAYVAAAEFLEGRAS